MLSSSPRHFAASHVLHRLLAPRHPPSALSCLTINLAATHSARANPRRARSVAPNALGLGLKNPIRLSKTADESAPTCIESAALEGRIVCLSRASSQYPGENGGADRDRTDDLRLAKPALSQLSYSPPGNWWAWVDSNYRPPAYQADALTN